MLTRCFCRAGVADPDQATPARAMSTGRPVPDQSGKTVPKGRRAGTRSTASQDRIGMGDSLAWDGTPYRANHPPPAGWVRVPGGTGLFKEPSREWGDEDEGSDHGPPGGAVPQDAPSGGEGEDSEASEESAASEASSGSLDSNQTGDILTRTATA